MRHISLVGNENYILIRFFVTWKIPLRCLTLQGSFWGALMGRLPPSPGPGWHYLPHKHTWGVTHGPHGHAQGERVMIRQSQWPVVQGNEMHLNITGYYNGRAEGLVCRWRRRHCGETLSEISYTSVHGKKCPSGRFYCKKKTNILSQLLPAVLSHVALFVTSALYITLWFCSSMWKLLYLNDDLAQDNHFMILGRKQTSIWSQKYLWGHNWLLDKWFNSKSSIFLLSVGKATLFDRTTGKNRCEITHVATSHADSFSFMFTSFDIAVCEDICHHNTVEVNGIPFGATS